MARNHPDLEPYLVTGVVPTGKKLGSGAYGSVEEVVIPGAVCAAKQIHDQLIEFGTRIQVQKWISGFVHECRLMSLLRHPHIVQFLGICYLPESNLPVLLMEMLVTNLDHLLETTPRIPLDIKVTILIGVASGLVYLHSHIPSIIHRDLTARNILLDQSLTAKIADLGVARMVNIQPGELAATMTSAPGNALYMPPEAVGEEHAKYNTAIDIFSFGNIALFTFTQIYPKDLKGPTFSEPVSRKLVARSEIDRRSEYIQVLRRDLHDTQPLVQLVLSCLEYLPEDRPSAVNVIEQLKESQATIPQNWSMTRLDLIGRVQQVEQVRQEEQLRFKRELDQKQREIDHQQIVIDSQHEEVLSLRAQLTDQRSHDHQVPYRLGQGVVELPPIPVWNVKFDWNRLNDIPEGISPDGLPVLVNKKVYVRVNSIDVSEYTPGLDLWIKLPSPPVKYFTITCLNHQLALIGGRDVNTHKATSRITVWDSERRQWVYPYPLLKTLCHSPSAVGYHHYLIVTGGMDTENKRMKSVEIFDGNTHTSFKADSLPQTDNYSTLVVGDTLYLVGRGHRRVLRVNVLHLITRAKQETYPSSSPIWETLTCVPYPESSPFTIDNKLLVVGGNTNNVDCDFDFVASIFVFSPITNQWSEVGSLPVACSFCPCLSLPSGEVLVLGGWRAGLGLVKSVYIASINFPIY